MSRKIKLDTNNFRTHPEENQARIKKSLTECGAGRSILIDSEDEIIAGNGVYKQAKNLDIPIKIIESDGSELIVVKRTDLNPSDEKRKRLALYDNALSNNVTWNYERLQEGFTESELNELDISIPKQFDVMMDISAKEAFEEGKVQFPITIISSKEEFDRWTALKEEYGISNDLKLFTKLMSEL